MTGRYLTEAADVLRAAGCNVIEQDGWRTRSRSSGGYADPLGPVCVMWHHTASDGSPANQAHFQSYTADARPIANCSIAPNGDVWMLAAGATNTNGQGVALTFSRGTVPANGMNTRAWGVEIMNGGTGTPYPVEQIDAAFKVCNAINALCRNQPTDVGVHSVYAPGRKIDPATAAAVQGPWRPAGFNGRSDSWVLNPDLSAECARRASSAPGPDPQPPTPDPEPTGGLITMYLLGVLGPNSPQSGDSTTPTVIRVGADTVTWEANATAQGIDQWFGVPYKQASDADASTLLVTRRGTNPLSGECSNPSSPYYCPALAGAWRT